VVHTLGIRNYFRSLTSGDHVTNGKPAPDIFLLCAKNLGIEPAHCLVIEDTNAGIQAAKAAGMTCVAIPCPATAHQDHSQADRILSSLEELDLRSLTSASCRKITVP
jgi:beta-phosphoglucomutase-like phosphatase (HAD superfamily)